MFPAMKPVIYSREQCVSYQPIDAVTSGKTQDASESEGRQTANMTKHDVNKTLILPRP